MGRQVNEAKITTRNARSKLKTRKAPHWRAIDRGAHLGYRKGVNGGTWVARYKQTNGAYVTKALAAADDALEANGVRILDYSQALQKAREWYEEQSQSGAPNSYTVANAITDYLSWYRQHRKGIYEVTRRSNADIIPELGEIDLPRKLSLFEFDDRYTAPQSNFRDARHYYETCSSLPLLPSVRIPCRILYSGDDPLVDSTALDTQSLPDNIERLKTRRGGHLGFVAAPWRTGGYRWMDQVVLRWLDEEKAKN